MPGVLWDLWWRFPSAKMPFIFSIWLNFFHCWRVRWDGTTWRCFLILPALVQAKTWPPFLITGCLHSSPSRCLDQTVTAWGLLCHASFHCSCVQNHTSFPEWAELRIFKHQRFSFPLDSTAHLPPQILIWTTPVPLLGLSPDPVSYRRSTFVTSCRAHKLRQLRWHLQ